MQQHEATFTKMGQAARPFHRALSRSRDPQAWVAEKVLQSSGKGEPEKATACHAQRFGSSVSRFL